MMRIGPLRDQQREALRLWRAAPCSGRLNPSGLRINPLCPPFSFPAANSASEFPLLSA